MSDILNKIKFFFLNLLEALKKTFWWVFSAYSITLVYFFIVFAIRRKFDYDMEIILNLLATNACFSVSLAFLVDDKKYKSYYNMLLIFSIVAFSIFSFDYEEDKKMIISEGFCFMVAILTLIFSVVLGFLSKYTEVYNDNSAKAKARANASMEKNKTKINNKTIAI